MECSKNVPPMYDQAYVDMLKYEVEHWKKLYRNLLMEKTFGVK